METFSVFVIGVLALCAGWLLVRLALLRSSLKEAVKELDEKLDTDTNTLISLSTRDIAMRAFVVRINRQLCDLRRERLKLRQTDTELNDAIAGISHDLRTPLTAICGYLDLLDAEPLAEKAKGYLGVIRERTDAMRTLSEELFSYTLMNAETDALVSESVCLNDILEQSLAGFYGIFTERGIVPEITLTESPVIRTLDSNALRRIFDNILGNAAKYSDGDLNVSLTDDGVICFENGAAELTAVQTAQLFNRFFTVNNAKGASGLGLAIAKRLTEKMNGKITAEYRRGRLSVCVMFKKPQN